LEAGTIVGMAALVVEGADLVVSCRDAGDQDRVMHTVAEAVTSRAR
jgi:hypothetical protein